MLDWNRESHQNCIILQTSRSLHNLVTIALPSDDLVAGSGAECICEIDVTARPAQQGMGSLVATQLRKRS
jgi:hypothetical protein